MGSARLAAMAFTLVVLPQVAAAFEPAAGTPICVSRQHCESMWVAAQEYLGLASGMRTRLATDNRLETYAPTSSSKMGGVVTKEPVEEGAYEIRLRLYCYYGDSCWRERDRMTRAFNLSVGLTAPPALTLNKPKAQPAQAVDTIASQPPKLIADELIKLADLRKRGILTEAEFQKQKKALLGP